MNEFDRWRYYVKRKKRKSRLEKVFWYGFLNRQRPVVGLFEYFELSAEGGVVVDGHDGRDVTATGAVVRS